MQRNFIEGHGPKRRGPFAVLVLVAVWFWRDFC
jgi:hypothetical protein